MKKLLKASATVLVAGVAVASLALAGTVTAGAAKPGVHTHAHARTHRLKHHFSLATFKCSNADRALTRIQKARSGIAAGLPRMTAREARASARGHTVRAERIKKRISRRESPKFSAWLAKAATGIEAKCHVSPPPAPSSLPTPGSTQA